RKEAEDEIRYKNEILSAINTITTLLLTKNNKEEIFDSSFNQIAKVINADRFYFFENDFKTNLLSQKFEWVKREQLAEIDNEQLQNFPHDVFPELIFKLLKKESYNSIVSEIEEGNFKTILLEQSIKSILVIPLFYQERFIGFIGFDDCINERMWTQTEIQTLTTLASNIATTLIRIENEKNLIENQEKTKYKNAVLNLISKYTNILIQKNNIDEFFDESLAQFITHINSDRICFYAFENENFSVNQIFEWFKEGNILNIRNPKFQ